MAVHCAPIRAWERAPKYEASSAPVTAQRALIEALPTDVFPHVVRA